MKNHNIPTVKRAVIFDFGGVLMKTTSQRPRYAWDDRLGLAHGSVEKAVHGSQSWRKAQLGEIPIAEYWADVARQLHLSQKDVQQLEQDYFSADRLDDDLMAYIRELRAEAYSVALLSNDSPALLNKLYALGIADLFEPLIISGVIGVMKPAAAAYQAVLKALNRLPNETVFIDDMPANIDGAQAVGMYAIRYVDEMDLRAALMPLLTINDDKFQAK
jgi:putative hydrolase of the HAD superfamily